MAPRKFALDRFACFRQLAAEDHACAGGARNEAPQTRFQSADHSSPVMWQARHFRRLHPL